MVCVGWYVGAAFSTHTLTSNRPGFKSQLCLFLVVCSSHHAYEVAPAAALLSWGSHEDWAHSCRHCLVPGPCSAQRAVVFITNPVA